MSCIDNDILAQNIKDSSCKIVGALPTIEEAGEAAVRFARAMLEAEKEPRPSSTSFYRFQAMAKLGEWTNIKQLGKVIEEVGEAHDALEAMCNQFRWAFTTHDEAELKMADRARNAYGMELMDVIHAAETALRIEFSDFEVGRLRDAVERKNRERGYYE